MSELVIKSKIKEFVPEDIRISAELAEALDNIVKEILKKAAERAKANHRTTILVQDL